jgi:phosphoribosylformylglycinamidine (FGAM) synthase-like amidotransferase family enzyme
MYTSLYTKNQVLRIPIAHAEGNYYADPETIAALEAENRVAFRYCDTQGNPTPESNPNGAIHNIAGIINEEGNVLGMMPHPERLSEVILVATTLGTLSIHAENLEEPTMKTTKTPWQEMGLSDSEYEKVLSILKRNVPARTGDVCCHVE